jgi:hypothetical protein
MGRVPTRSLVDSRARRLLAEAAAIWEPEEPALREAGTRLSARSEPLAVAWEIRPAITPLSPGEPATRRARTAAPLPAEMATALTEPLRQSPVATQTARADTPRQWPGDSATMRAETFPSPRVTGLWQPRLDLLYGPIHRISISARRWTTSSASGRPEEWASPSRSMTRARSPNTAICCRLSRAGRARATETQRRTSFLRTAKTSSATGGDASVLMEFQGR